jgi:hypothetical protein
MTLPIIAVDDSADHFRHIVVCRFGLIVFLQELGLRVKNHTWLARTVLKRFLRHSMEESKY